MKTYINPLAQKIQTILIPLIGEFMASGVLKTQCGNIGITEETITPLHLSQLSEGIGKGLVLFVGSDSAKQISAKIKEMK